MGDMKPGKGLINSKEYTFFYVPESIGGLPCFKVEGYKTLYFPVELILQHLIAPYEGLERTVISRTYTKHDRVLEGGTGTGISTVTIAQFAEFVVSYEPLPNYVEVARVNIAANNANAIVNNAALAMSNGAVSYSRRAIASASSGLDDKLYGEPTLEVFDIPAVSIDDEVRKYNINGIHLDVEGSEYELLTNMDLSQIDKITMEVHPTVIGVGRVDSMFEHLRWQGFHMAGMCGGRFFPKTNYAVSFAREEFLDEIEASAA